MTGSGADSGHLGARGRVAALACRSAGYWAVMAAAAMASQPTPAHAHGRGAKTACVALGPQRWWQRTPPTWLVGLTFGAMVSHDGGQSFNWICEDAVGGVTGIDPVVAVADANTMAWGTTHGLFVSRDGGCTWVEPGTLTKAATIGAILVHPHAPNTWTVADNSPQHGRSRLWRTVDAGATFSPLPFDVHGMFVTSIAASPKVPQRLAVAGSNNRGNHSALAYNSDDGGQTWRGGLIEGAPAASAGWRIALDATDANIVVVAGFDLAHNVGRVLRSTDAGLSFAAVALPDAEPPQSLLSAGDGTFVLAGARHLFVSHDHGLTFAADRGLRGNACVASFGNRLVACGSEGLDRTSLATRPADGDTWSPIVRLRALRGPFHCGVGTQVYDICSPQWPEQAQRLGAVAAVPEAAGDAL